MFRFYTEAPQNYIMSEEKPQPYAFRELNFNIIKRSETVGEQ